MKMEKQLFMAIGVVGLVLVGLSSAYGDIPLMINHQGLVKVEGFPFDGTGYFRFAIVDPDSGYNVWTNDGTKLGTSQTPTDAVTLPVVKGMYNVRLGDVSIPNMPPISSAVFDDDNVVLRVWFSDGSHGTELLDPDQVITSAAYAYHALTAETAAIAGDADTVDGQDAGDLAMPPGYCIVGYTATTPPGYTYVGAMSGTNEWAAKAAMIDTRKACAAAVVNGVIYATGGDASGTDALHDAYDPATNSWTRKASLPTGRRSLAAAAVDGVIYAIGGSSGSTAYETVNEAYDPVGDSWSTKPTMPTGRHSLAVAVVDGVIYAIGGRSSPSNYLTVNEAYDPVGESWSTKEPMLLGRYGLAAAAVGETIYAIGGDAGVPSPANQAYDTVANSWSTKAPMPAGRSNLAAASLGGIVYAIGGTSATDGFETANEAYDPIANSWSTRAPMPTRRTTVAAAVAGGQIYAIAGTLENGTRSNATEAYAPAVYLFRKD